MVRRSRFEVYIDILECVYEGFSSPTHIMYKANLSWSSLQEYLNSLLKQGLILAYNTGSRRRYRITDAGVRVLNYFREIEKELPAVVTPSLNNTYLGNT